MLSLGNVHTQVHYNTFLHSPKTQPLLFPFKTHCSFSTRLHFHAVMQTGLCCNALKPKKKGDFSVTEIDGPDEIEDDFDDEFLDFEDDGEFEGDEDDDEVIVPLENMKKWIANRPQGFGEGKVYDTSVEDKLMEEIEQSRKAQLANVNKLKNNPVNPSPKKETSKQDKGSTHIQDGFLVRLINLPKKKNIHRDLQLAFKGVPGILNIVPVVSGNEKTRDPVCRGLAFVHFKYQDEAQRFVQNFSGKSISFGKVQKQLTCEMMKPQLLKSASAQSVDECNHAPQRAELNLNEDLDAAVETGVPRIDSWKETVHSELHDADERHVSAQWEDDEEITGTLAFSDSDLAEELEIGDESAINASSSKQISKLKKNEKKVASKSRDRIPKSNIPGSTNRLKLREKAVLTGVFPKYGANATSTVKDDEEINRTSAFSDSDLAEELEVGDESAINSSSSKQISKLKKIEKKVATKRRKDRIPKSNIPGSANRLKVSDKVVLTGVFSKYGANATSTVKEQTR